MVPTFKIGSVSVNGKVILAPMDGISDQPFRWLCRRMGSALSVSEFINVRDVPEQLNNVSERVTFTQSERPFAIQLYGDDPAAISQAAALLEERSPDFFDLNLGCSVRRIAGRGAGAGLLKDPEKIRIILSSLRKAIKIPFTIKLRLGWDLENKNYIEIAKMAEGEGVSMISLHGRTKTQNWDEPAEWNAITILKKSVDVPVVGNGDIKSPSDIQKMLDTTGCDAVMIGRASLGNPWLFSEINKRDLSCEDILVVARLHWFLMQSFYGIEKAKTIFKKHLKAYLNCSQFNHLNIKKVIRSDNPMRYFL